MRRSSVLVLAVLAVLALLCLSGVDARRHQHHRSRASARAAAAPRASGEIDVRSYERVVPSQGNRRSPLPHDLMAPNGGAPWQGGKVFKAAPTGQQVRPLPTEPQADGPIAQTQYGAVQGYLDDGVNVWRGVPFAAPPVGQFRLREPQDALAWQGVREAYEEAPICPQIHVFDWLFAGEEDCLYADIYTPASQKQSGELLPVFVWIYGGAWILGDAYEFGMYDGHNIALGRNHVIVSFNYRLGPLGFMTNDALRADNPAHYGGNYALLDQVKALQWVQKNIANFGGDPNRVTIGGESAGGFSTCWHLASPLSKGLFHAAIIESGTCNDDNFFVEYPLNRNWTNTFSQMVGCDPNVPAAQQLTCLRNLPTGVIMGNLLGSADKNVTENMQSIRDAHANVLANTSWGYHPRLFPLMSWSATIDGVSLLRSPLAQIWTGNYNKVPVIAGTNNDEGTMFVPLMPMIVPGTHFPTEASDLPLALNHFFGNNATITNGVLAEYPVADYKSPEECFNAILRDFMFVCSARRALSAMDAQGADTWLYHWWYVGDWVEDPILGDYHSAELEFVWDNQFPPLIHAFSEKDQAMADTVDTYWSNMVWSYNPNGNASSSRTGDLRGEEYWSQYDDVQKQNIILAQPTQMQQDYWQKQCDFWDQFEPGSLKP